MPRRFVSLWPIAVLGLSLSTAHADTIAPGTYSLSGVTVSAGSTTYSLTGTVTLGSNDLLTASDIVLNDPALGDPTFNIIGSTAGPAGYAPVADYGYITSTANIGQIDLSYLPTTDSSDVISLCILSASNCNAYQASTIQIYGASAFGYNLVDLTGGSLDPAASVAPTPEPASAVLLATGILAMALLGCRRRTAQNVGLSPESLAALSPAPSSSATLSAFLLRAM
jgi:hypothetical protein